MREMGQKTHGPRFRVFLQPPQVSCSAVSYSEDSRAKKRIMAMAKSAAKGSKENSIQSSPLDFLSFDHSIRPCQDIRRNRQGDLLSGFEIDNELELLRLLHLEVGGLWTLQNLVHVGGGAPVKVCKVHSVGHKPPGFHI